MKQDEHLKILTWNLWIEPFQRQARLRSQISEIATHNPDIICIQEVFEQAPEEIAKALGMKLVIKHQASASSPGYNAILAKKNLKVHSSNFYIFEKQEQENQQDRSAVTALLSSPSAALWQITCTHLAWGHKEAIRQAQLFQIEQHNKQTKQDNPHLRQVLCGDINAIPSSHSIRYITGLDPDFDTKTDTYWVDAWATTHPNEPGYTSTPHNQNSAQTATKAGILRPELLPHRRIDYILVRGYSYGSPAAPLQTKLIGNNKPHHSDHFGILATLWDPAA